MMGTDPEETRFCVVLNPERQYALWPEWKTVPDGWEKADVAGDKASCLAFIEKNWTDMRPLSLQQDMD